VSLYYVVEMDRNHYQKEGTVENVEFPVDNVARATLDFRKEDDGEVNEGFEMIRFATDEMLKFADTKKGTLKEKREEGEDIGEFVQERLDGETLKFLYTPGHKVLGVVSPDFQAIPTERVDDLVTDEIARQGIELEDKTVESVGSAEIITRVTYTLGEATEVEDVGDGISAGLTIENSVFGARALRLDKFYEVLACENGMTLPQEERVFRQVHMGDREMIEEDFTKAVGQEIWTLWEDLDLIEKVNDIHFPEEEQVEWLENLVEEDRLTQKASDAIQEAIEEGEYNSGGDSVWSLINAFTGRAEHEEVSRSEMQTLEKLYTELLTAEEKEEVLAIAE